MKNIAKKALFCASTLILLTACASSSFEFQRTLKFAEQGDPESQYSVAWEYYDGSKNTKQDYVQALKWFKRAALNGKRPFGANTGQWFKQTAFDGTGILGARYKVGVMYIHGQGVKKDFKEARNWLEPITNEHSLATYALGAIYYQGGYGIEKDNKKAAHYFEQACKRNEQLACKAFDELKKEQ